MGIGCGIDDMHCVQLRSSIVVWKLVCAELYQHFNFTFLQDLPFKVGDKITIISPCKVRDITLFAASAC